jgi:hypothetical protein
MYFISDWAILNDTTPIQLQRILPEVHYLSDPEIHLACILLKNYHSVYRRDRLQQRRAAIKSGQSKVKGRCLPPTLSQLHEIAQRINAEVDLGLEPEEVESQLQTLAKRLRQYRADVRARLAQQHFWTNYSHCSGDIVAMPNELNRLEFVPLNP